MQKNKRLKLRRPFLMLEVLIAFALVLLSAIPLIYPHVSMIKAQHELINKININHSANLIYVSLLEKLHKNEIPLIEIESGKIFNLEQENLKSVFGYKATYQFFLQKVKKRNADGLKTYLVTMQLKFIPNSGQKSVTYDYSVFIASQKQAGTVDEPLEEEDDDEE